MLLKALLKCFVQVFNCARQMLTTTKMLVRMASCHQTFENLAHFRKYIIASTFIQKIFADCSMLSLALHHAVRIVT